MSIKDRANLKARPNRPEPEPEPDPFVPPVRQCPRCGAALEFKGGPGDRGFGKVSDLRVGGCPDCRLVAAMTEKVNPEWREADHPAILTILARDMIEGERTARVWFSDGDDPMWTG